MRVGAGTRLFAVSLVAILVGIGASSALLERSLHRWVQSSIEEELLRHARTIRQVLEAQPGGMSIHETDSLADRLGGASSCRVTIVDEDGTTLGDTWLAVSELRPPASSMRGEFDEVRSRGLVISRGHDELLGGEMLYAVLPFRRAEKTGFLRTGMPLSEVDELAARLRAYVLVAGLFGFGAAVVVGAVGSHQLSNSMRRLVSSAHAVAQRDSTAAGPRGSVIELADELDRTVRTLGRERDRFEAVLEGMSEGVLALDAEGRVTVANPAARLLLEVKEIPAGTSPKDLPALECLRGVIGNALAGPAAVEFTTAHGSRTVLGHAAPLPDGQGTVVVMLDVTEPRRVEQVRRDFIANASHELRTPVAVVRANAEALLDGGLADPELAGQFLHALVRHSERLSRIIESMLDLSSLEAGHQPLQSGPLSVKKAIRSAVELVERGHPGRHHGFETSVEQDAAVLGDAGALERVLINLLDNAVKYSPASSPIEIRAATSGSTVRIEVQDLGPGLSPDSAERVFERFFRVDAGRSRELGGTGLGLAIVRRLVETMGGTVGVRPGSKGGSVFWVDLPRAGADVADAADP